jgi:hypothetical protein
MPLGRQHKLGRVALVGVGVGVAKQPSVRLQKQASGRWSRDALIAESRARASARTIAKLHR